MYHGGTNFGRYLTHFSGSSHSGNIYTIMVGD
ncbi:hypothetical protein V2J09_022765 [Rumex salicifolius]